METSFDLTREAWIPCVDQAGAPLRLGLRAVLARAHEIRGIVHRSPFVTFALHRLLLAILHRVFGPKNENEWADLARAGRWDVTRLEAYFDQWQDRFDLFHPTRPFYQVPIDAIDKARSVRCIIHELPQGNNTVLWDPYRDQDPVLTPVEAACYLVAAQAYADGGIKTGIEANVSRTPSRASHLSRGIAVLLEGDSLFRTLLLNMVCYDPAQETRFGSSQQDIPTWESDRIIGGKPRRPNGYLDLLTWQPRRIRLLASERNGRVVVDRVILAVGEELPSGQQEIDLASIETMMPFVARSETGTGATSYRPQKPDPTRGVWRDSLSLFYSLTPHKTPARTVEIAADRLQAGLISPQERYRLAVFGPVWADANYTRLIGWVDERLPLPAIYLSATGETKREFLGEALQHAENGAAVLFQIADTMARAIEHPGKDTSALSGAAKARVSQRRETLLPSVTLSYWAVLGSSFPALVEEIAAADDQGAEARLVEWARLVRSQVLAHAEALIGRIAPVGGRNLRAIAEAERTLQRGLRRYNLAESLTHKNEQP